MVFGIEMLACVCKGETIRSCKYEVVHERDGGQDAVVLRYTMPKEIRQRGKAPHVVLTIESLAKE
jgi:hypothetical protein